MKGVKEMIQTVKITVEYDDNYVPIAVDIVHRQPMNEHRNPANAMRIMEMATLEMAKYVGIEEQDLKDFEIFRIEKEYDRKGIARFNGEPKVEQDFECEECKDTKVKVLNVFPFRTQIVSCNKCRPH